MADIYDRSRAMAIRMLAPRSKGGKGLELTLVRTVKGQRDPATGGSATTTVEHFGSGMRSSYELDDIDGTYIKQGDVKLLISPVLLSGGDMPQPTTLDRVLFDGVSYTVCSVGPWNYAGVNIGFEAQARA